MSEDCTGCGLNKKSKMSWKWFGSAIVGGLVVAVIVSLAMRQPVMAKGACMTREQVATATKDMGKCLTIFGGGVYDFTVAKRWDLTGHVGKHLCGKEYDQSTIESGPHKVEVIDAFYSTNICGESAVREKVETTNVIQSINGLLREKTGVGLFTWSSYLALFFFILNFLTCYAMPWARVRQPWEGSVPGSDVKDVSGRFPLTYWHKQFAWMAILMLSVHGVLGFACLWFKICF